MSSSSRTAAVVALVAMLLLADVRAASPVPPASTADLLAAFAAAADESAQSDAARALIGAPDRKAVTAAMVPLLAAPDRRTRCNAGWVLAATGDARGFNAVLAELTDAAPRAVDPSRTRSDGSPDVKGQIISDRYYAAWVLGELRDPRAVPALLALLTDPTLDYQAAIALGQIGSRDAIEPLKRHVGGMPPARQFWPHYALAKLGDPSGLGALLAELTAPEPARRAMAADVLGEFKGDRRVLPALTGALQDADVNVRRRVIGGLATLGDRAAIAALRESLRDLTPLAPGEPTTIADEARAAIGRIEAATPATSQPAP